MAERVQQLATVQQRTEQEVASLRDSVRALTEAQNQIAAIDLRLKNPPKLAVPAARPATAAASLDLSKLPQGTDTGPSSEKLPTEEGMGPGAATPAETPVKSPDKAAPSGKDGGTQNTQSQPVKVGAR